MWWLSGEASRGRRWEQIKFCGFKGAEWELTKQRWCLFSLWLVMGGCSQHKHMPSWLAHFLPHSTSLRRATQAQDTTAGPLCSLSLHEHIHAICMLRAPWWTRSLNACYQCTNIWEKRCSDIWDQRTDRTAKIQKSSKSDFFQWNYQQFTTFYKSWQDWSVIFVLLQLFLQTLLSLFFFLILADSVHQSQLNRNVSVFIQDLWCK